MIVHPNAAERNFEIITNTKELDPCHVKTIVPFLVDQVTRLIVAADLKIAAIFAKAHREDAVLNDALLLHHVINGLKSINIHAWAF